MASRALLVAVRAGSRASAPAVTRGLPRAAVVPRFGIAWSSTSATSSSTPTAEGASPSAGATPAPPSTTVSSTSGTISSRASTTASSSTLPASPVPTPSPEPWIRTGIHPAVAQRLVEVYPQAVAPTPAQRAFLLTVMRGDTDVYLKDYMGRGKTFALALCALSLALSAEHQVAMLVPTPHLAQQVSDLLLALAPQGSPLHCLVTEDVADWDARVLVMTPRVLNDANAPELEQLTHVLIDEPDTMLGPLPGRFLSALAIAKHPVNKHPPPIVPALNHLLGIKTIKRDRSKGKRGAQGRDSEPRIDFSGRRTDIRTVWASATFGPAMRRFVYGRGWTLGTQTSGGASRGVVDLNFTASSSAAQREVVDTLAQISDAGGISASEPEHAPKPQHYALVVSSSGGMSPLTVDFTAEPIEAERMQGEEKVPLTVVEAMAFIHATSPPPPGTYALALPPRGGSVNALATELGKLGIATAPLVPEALEGGLPPLDPEAETDDPDSLPPVLVAQRHMIAGLHLPQLHTVYMLNGLDMVSLSPAQQRIGGRHERETQYGVVAGRLGRMGTQAAYVPGRPQRVISLVAEDGYEHNALKDLFAGRLNADGLPPHRLLQWEGEL